ncbi:hypothetical protein ACTXJX_14895 [Glutamicibacter ardleyensis]|uniref:hypothetical protein n=1 Tax=Glutamicibacter ardleyensis TaxID=225894 RepID=UPI003FD1A839
MSNNADLSRLRKHYLTEPGTPLIITEDPIARLYNASQFADNTGLPRENITTDTLCSVPLPVVTPDMTPERPYARVNPAMLWHPLFWLPSRLTERDVYVDDDGEEKIEDDVMWSLRLSLELLAGMIYSPELGWLDMMELVGIDVTNPADLERIRRWQNGAEDEALDSINLDELMQDKAEPNWAMETSQSLVDEVERAQWSVHASALSGYINAGLETNDPEDVCQRLFESAVLMDADFAEVTDELLENLDTEYLVNELDALFNSRQQVPMDALKAYALPMINVFNEISTAFAESVEVVQEAFTPQGD